MTLDELNIAIGGRVRQARTLRGVSQAALAQDSDVERASIVNLEHGRHVTLKLLLAVADALDVDVASLIPSSRSVDAEPLPSKAQAVSDDFFDREDR